MASLVSMKHIIHTQFVNTSPAIIRTVSNDLSEGIIDGGIRKKEQARKLEVFGTGRRLRQF